MASFRTNLYSKALVVALALGGCLSPVWAQPKDRQLPELASTTSDKLNDEFRPAYDGKDWDKALRVLEEILAKATPDSYDAAYIYKVHAQINMQNKNNMLKGMEDLEKALAIDDRKHYFEQKDVQDLIYTISQINFQEGGSTSTKDPAAKIQYFNRALSTMERWLQNATPKSFTQDSTYFIAAVYFAFGDGTAMGNQKTDPAMLEKALHWIDKALQSAIHPREILYSMKVSGLYQLNRFKEVADYLELQLKLKPDDKSKWQTLASIYLQLGNAAEQPGNAAEEKKDRKASYSCYVHAIVTIERAQKLGYMTTPKENFNLITIYGNIDQYPIACDLLDKGLNNETIESTPQNWQILGGWYQAIHRDDKAIEAFKKAAELFPTNGEIEYQLAQVYVNASKESEAFEHMKLCLAKGGSDKPHVGWLMYAYTAMDLKKYDEAEKGAMEAEAAATKAHSQDGVDQAKKIKKAIDANRQDIENRKQMQNR